MKKLGYGEVIYGEEMQPRKRCHTLQNFIYLFSFQLNFLSPVSHGVLIILQLAAIKIHATGFLCVWFSLWTIGLTLYDQFLTSSSFTHEYANSEYPPTFLFVISWIWFPVLNLLVCHNFTRMSQYCKYSALPVLHPILFLVSCCERGSLLEASNCHLFIFHNRKRSLAMHLCTTAVSITTVLSFE